MNYIYPIGFFINYSSLSLIIVVLSLAGSSAYAAEVAIIGSILTLSTQSFSANIRNLAFNKSLQTFLNIILKFRIYFLIPILLITAIMYNFTISVTEISFYVAISLMSKKVLDWIDETHLINEEIKNNKKIFVIYIILQISSILGFIIFVILNKSLYGIIFWCFFPILFTVKYIKFTSYSVNDIKLGNIKQFLPHIGSSIIIALSVYIFRLLIINYTNKEIAGDLFAAFAFGGILGSLMSNALSPSLVKYMNDNNKINIPSIFQIIFLIFVLGGLGITYLSFNYFNEFDFLGKNSYFWKASGLSMIGGALMTQAQIKKSYILQHLSKQNIIGVEIMYNIMLISAIPISIILFELNFLPFLYLLSAILAFCLYMSFAYNKFSKDNLFDWLKPRFSSAVIILICVPIFFQIRGNIFAEEDLINLGQNMNLFMAPLPVLLITVPLIIIIYSEYNKANFGFNVIFFFFIMMVLSLLSKNYENGEDFNVKFISIIQYIIPLFGIIIFHFIKSSDTEFEKKIYNIFFLFLLLYLPTQLLASYSKELFTGLTSDLYFFSIYQNTQYIPTIIVSCFLIILPQFWNKTKYKYLLIVIGLLLTFYVTLSTMLLAKLFLIFGLVLFALSHYLFDKNYKSLIYSFVLLFFISINPTIIELIAKNEDFIFKNNKEYMSRSELKEKYLTAALEEKKILSNLSTFKYFYSIKQSNHVYENLAIGKNYALYIYGDEVFRVSKNVKSTKGTFYNKITKYLKLPQLNDRLKYWKFCSKEIFSSFSNFLFGNPSIYSKNDFINHDQFSEKSLYFTSAHNYYIDVIFNFGFLPLIPILFLYYFFFKRIIVFFLSKDLKKHTHSSKQIIMIAFIVFYFLTIENNLLVSMKQPFSGIYIFFILALLLKKLNKKNCKLNVFVNK